MRSQATGRNSTACFRCHRRKVKCSREIPCRNCLTANQECKYPVREKIFAVPENYLRDLEARARRQTDAFADHRPLRPTTFNTETTSRPLVLVEDSTSEVFVSKLKDLPKQDSQYGPRQSQGSGRLASNTSPEYVRLSIDHFCSPTTLKLPPYPYALVLLQQFDIFLGHDWHWFLRQTFRERLDQLYQNPSSVDARDKIWLCKFLVVCALGETYIMAQAPEINFYSVRPMTDSQDAEVAPRGSSSLSQTPGTIFFEQALSLFRPQHEEPSLDQIETLNLIAFYCYSLNRKRDSYMYTGISARMSNLLKLGKPAEPFLSAVEAEHRKRIWWTTYCLDRMASTELGLAPAFNSSEAELEYPVGMETDFNMNGEFADASTLTAQIQLAFIHADICENMKSLNADDDMNIGELTRSTMDRLQAVKASLPAHLSFDFEEGFPLAMKEMTNRSLASLYQRYHQCFILLLRPLFLKQISHLLSNRPNLVVSAIQSDLAVLTNACLRAARSNLNIIIGLRHCDKMTKFGFWESLHLFSALMILSLTRSVNARWPKTFDEMPDDTVIYDTGKILLEEMQVAGNLASKEHGSMLTEVEAFSDMLFDLHGAVQEFDSLDVDEWMNQMLEF